VDCGYFNILWFVNFVHAIGCNQWTSEAKTTILKSRDYIGFAKRRVTTVEECQKECVNDAKCTGVQWSGHICEYGGLWSPGTGKDYRFTYYKLTRTCPAPATNSSKRCSSCLRLYRVRHI